jgi:uncharacterized protein (TIGR02217 family)
MSNLRFPQLRGVAWNIHLAPQWKTGRQESRSGREVATRFRVQPRMKITLSYGTGDDGFLSDRQPKPADDGSVVYSDFDTMFGFLNMHGGEHDTFLFQGVNAIDLKKYVRTGESIGTGDGATTDFQLQRDLGGWKETVYWVLNTPVFYIDGIPVDPANVTDLGHGKYRLSAAPANGALITADFTFAHRCRFDADEIDFANWSAYFWECGTVPLITVKP